SIYQAAGIQYGIRWEILAAINEIETDYGRNLNVSTAGAVGWMQFLPTTWKKWGVDANRDHVKDPYNPVDAIFSSARYLKAAGAADNLHRAIFAYNHADWYVDSVLLRARLIGGLPADFVGSLTGLTEGHFPVHGKATYADDLNERAATPTVDVVKERLWANPSRPQTFKQGGRDQILDMGGTVPGLTTFKSYFTELFGLKRDEVYLKRMKPGSKVIAGTILGRIGRTGSAKAPHVTFEIR